MCQLASYYLLIWNTVPERVTYGRGSPSKMRALNHQTCKQHCTSDLCNNLYPPKWSEWLIKRGQNTNGDADKRKYIIIKHQNQHKKKECGKNSSARKILQALDPADSRFILSCFGHTNKITKKLVLRLHWLVRLLQVRWGYGGHLVGRNVTLICAIILHGQPIHSMWELSWIRIRVCWAHWIIVLSIWLLPKSVACQPNPPLHGLLTHIGDTASKHLLWMHGCHPAVLHRRIHAYNLTALCKLRLQPFEQGARYMLWVHFSQLAGQRGLRLSAFKLAGLYW